MKMFGMFNRIRPTGPAPVSHPGRNLEDDDAHKTVAARLCEALGLDPTTIAAKQGVRIVLSNDRVVVEVVHQDRLVVDGEPELTRELKRYELVPINEDTP